MADRPEHLPGGESSSNGTVSNDEQSLAGRGRISAEDRIRIARMHQQGESLESISQQVYRSPRVVQKVIDVRSERPESSLTVKVDELIELLGDLPEEAMEPLLSLVKLRRQEKDIRARLLQFLKESNRL